MKPYLARRRGKRGDGSVARAAQVPEPLRSPASPAVQKSIYRRASHDPCVLTCLLSTFTFLSSQPARRPLSHAKPRRAPRRLDKAHGLNAKILVPFILSVIKKQITSCRRHEAISRAEARKAWRRFDGASRPGAGASANPCVPCGKKRHLPSCLARPMHAHLSTFYFPPSAGAAGPSPAVGVYSSG